MLKKQQLIDYAIKSVDDMLELKGHYIPEGKTKKQPFTGGMRHDEPLRKSQREALIAYREFLTNTGEVKRSAADRLTGFFDIATGLGKTGPFVRLVSGMRRHALKDGFNLQARIVVPTINLLYQTRDEQFGKYEPEMLEHIGLYGGGLKQLDKPITLMSYPAWLKLTKLGIIDGRNTDVLISDEGHRGLSPQKERKLLEHFNGNTLKLAFTATSRFDEKKVLERTHINRIYEKSINVALHDGEGEGELTEYANVEFYTIRVDPKDVIEMRKCLDEEIDPKWKHWETKESREQEARLMAKKKSWSNLALSVYAKGYDDRSDDPLSDNATAFYVKDTKHADALADMLNDPGRNMGLSKIAKARGFKGVAVAIHTRDMDKQEQLDRLADFKAGRYMAIVGDEKFKEGFDHKQLKTIIDWPHGSLVDKAQIVGRGTRRWFNEQKNRQEGLTFVDTVVYIGSDKPEQDAFFKRRAIKKAILASDILGASFILRGGKDEVPLMLPVDQLLMGERRSRELPSGSQLKIIKSIIEKNGPELIDLAWRMANKGLPEDEPISVMRHPKNENMYIVRDLRALVVKLALDPRLTKGTEVEKEFSHLSAKIMEEIRGDVPCRIVSPPKRKPIFLDDPNVEEFSTLEESRAFVRGRKEMIDSECERQENMVEVTTEIIASLKKHQKRTGIGTTNILTEANDAPLGLNVSTINNWIGGLTKTARKDYLDYVLNRYDQLASSEYANITSSVLARLKKYKKITGVNVGKLLEESLDVPEGLDNKKVNSWIAGDTKTAKRSHIDYLFKAYDNCDYIRVTPKILAKLRGHVERTGVGYKTIIKGQSNIPEGLTPSIIAHLLSGETQSIRKPYLEYVLQVYHDCAYPVHISKKNLDQLRSHAERTGVGGRSAILLRGQKNIPEGLTANIIGHWFTGRAEIALPEHINYVLNRYRALPDKPKPPSSSGGGWMALEPL